MIEITREYKEGSDPSFNLVTRNDIAKKLCVTTRTIDNWRIKGLIEGIKIGHSVRFNWEKVIKGLEEKGSNHYGN